MTTHAINAAEPARRTGGRPGKMILGYEWTERKWRIPRRWSNAELRRFGPALGGEIVNVSAWRDEDKEGGHYRDYFPGAGGYSITNWTGERGSQGAAGEFALNLDQPLPEELAGRFDVVFNHTTLEHVFDVFQAFRNLCEMSRDLVIVVVPCLQEVHFNEGFLDYWRFTPHALRRLFEANGLTQIYESASPEAENASIYLFAVGARRPERWAGKLPSQRMKDEFIGSEVIRNDPFTQAATVVYRLLRDRKLYRRFAKWMIRRTVKGQDGGGEA